jgi:hypothetical protein
VLATYLGAPILVDYGRHLVATFHPELSADTRVHRLFLSKLAGNGSGSQVGAGSRGAGVIRLTPRQFT